MPAFSNLANQQLIRWTRPKPPYIQGALPITYFASGGLLIRWPQPIRYQLTKPAFVTRGTYVNWGNLPLIRWQPGYFTPSQGSVQFTLQPLLGWIPTAQTASVAFTVDPLLSFDYAKLHFTVDPLLNFVGNLGPVALTITPDPLLTFAPASQVRVTFTLNPQLTFYDQAGQPPSCITGNGRLNPAFENFVF